MICSPTIESYYFTIHPRILIQINDVDRELRNI